MKTRATTNEEKQKPTDNGNDNETPIDILVSLAQEGEIDPWDIDIIRVTDKFLDRVDKKDLGRSGRAILYASMLLRMKSDYLVEEDDEEEEEEEPVMMGWGDEDWYDPGETFDGFDPVDQLENEMERRLKRRNVRERASPQTLNQLIRDLREMERDSWWKEGREYDTSKPHFESPIAPSTVEPTTEAAVSTAHDDGIEERIEEVWGRLSDEFEAREEVLFREIVAGIESRKRVVTAYISLLFLATRGRVRLEQDEFYGDLWIQRVNDDSSGPGNI
ncbi:MAG: ScpA family protein [Halobacteria archaeon]|nr:ScpA family protein [Halobacteria archaeon]